MEAYARSTTRTQYQDLIEEYAPLVKAAVNRVASCLPAEVDRGVLVGKAIMALIETAYSTPPGPLFEQQARANIWQSVVKWLGEQPWLVHRLQEAADRLYAAYIRVERDLDRTSASDGGIDTDRLAHQLETTHEQLEEWLREVTAYFTAWPRSFLGADQHDYTSQEIALAVSQLPPTSRLVVTLAHYEELSHEEIGEILAVSPEQVNSIYAKAALSIRAYLAQMR